MINGYSLKINHKKRKVSLKEEEGLILHWIEELLKFKSKKGKK